MQSTPAPSIQLGSGTAIATPMAMTTTLYALLKRHQDTSAVAATAVTPTTPCARTRQGGLRTATDAPLVHTGITTAMAWQRNATSTSTIAQWAYPVETGGAGLMISTQAGRQARHRTAGSRLSSLRHVLSRERTHRTTASAHVPLPGTPKIGRKAAIDCRDRRRVPTVDNKEVVIILAERFMLSDAYCYGL